MEPTIEKPQVSPPSRPNPALIVGVGFALLGVVFFLIKGSAPQLPSVSSKGWTEASVKAFVDECATNGHADLCQCVVNQLKETVLFEEYQQFKAASVSGQPPSLSTATAIGAAGAACQKR